MKYDEALIAGKLRRWEKYLDNYRLPEWEEIPDFGLYMEQVIVLLKQYLDYMPPELKEVKNDSTIERPARHISMDFGTPAGEEKPEFSSPSDTDKQLPEQTEEPAAESAPDRGQAETAKTSPDQSPTDADAKSDSENSELPK